MKAYGVLENKDLTRRVWHRLKKAGVRTLDALERLTDQEIRFLFLDRRSDAREKIRKEVREAARELRKGSGRGLWT